MIIFTCSLVRKAIKVSHTLVRAIKDFSIGWFQMRAVTTPRVAVMYENRYVAVIGNILVEIHKPFIGHKQIVAIPIQISSKAAR